MKTNTTLPKNLKHGFTLIEVIAVLVLLGILAAIAVPKYIDMAENAKDRALDAGIAELNGRETLAWGNVMLGTNGWVSGVTNSDLVIFGVVDAPLGSKYNKTLAQSGVQVLSFDGKAAVNLTRTASSATTPGSWSRP